MAGKLHVATIPQANDGDWSPTNAAHIARCDPDTIRALATEVLESREALAAKDCEIDRLASARAALEAQP
jgi:hypothetical protein